MKTQHTTLWVILAIMVNFMVISCKKDKGDDGNKSYPEENPLQNYFKNSGLDQKIDEFSDMHPIEFGMRFVPKVKGKITAVTVRLPQNTANVRVTIWNATAKHVLRTITVPTVVAAEETRQAIDALSIESEVSYAISINANNWYHREKTPRTNISYPVNAGNFFIQGYGYRAGSSQAFPDEKNILDYYTGEVGFVFQQTP